QINHIVDEIENVSALMKTKRPFRECNFDELIGEFIRCLLVRAKAVKKRRTHQNIDRRLARLWKALSVHDGYAATTSMPWTDPPKRDFRRVKVAYSRFESNRQRH